ncbi:DNA-binding domain-containing protein, AraC-type [Imperialibacter sp. EC-SDR9]|nr:DNA-binding domain-containing protein, AraC-type [Imperialibacter sp. 75]CAD5294784.1 DNA-binding domain-containing protein, AraC-type [Imperialibacter sp. 89]VVT12378.1 DNA-binding domain-containing protein, AraC-type [Imperialibacter sp. EC-SDR9]
MAIAVKKKIEDNVLIKVSVMKPVIKPTKAHKHAGYHELIFLSKGYGTHSIDDTVYEALPGAGYYLRPGNVHCWDFTSIPDGFVILFKEEAMQPYFQTIRKLISFSTTFSFGEDASLIVLVRGFYDAFKQGTTAEILSAHLNLILLRTLALQKEDRRDHPEVADFYNFKTLVNERFMDVRTVGEYAQLMNTSMHRLNAICKHVIQASALSVIHGRVLMEAKNLITHTTLNISEIAYQLNFSDSSNFVKFFKSLTSMTPTEYRAALQ